MNPLEAIGLLLALLAATTVLGLIWRARQGLVASGSGDVIMPADVASSIAFGPAATLVQFSTELCARCPGTRRLLIAVAEQRPGVVHVDVDLTHRADLANRYSVLQTPTTLILDGSGRVRARVGGAPNRADISATLDAIAQNTSRPLTTTPGS
ncbi:thioredoxin [Cryobacterium sp. TMT1-3]|uniref:Thioredoxin n=1 Tax=Cryobacterium luteum TaxID=1424661 RepID=A0A1H8K505_9MICO|nr:MULTISPECIES: thioredoxin family protein [Cryobacterium]TFB95106.1 thioredoxin [Cryobacterium luteum]TFC28615.1 thioredoxin [Cryobacterium sp. TMT1-3]SEN87757.1 Thioredoxin [Cryobacterium luteum]